MAPNRRKRAGIVGLAAALLTAGALALAGCSEGGGDQLATGQPNPAAPAKPAKSGKSAETPVSGNTTGKLLVASPSMRDPRFAETVIFMVEHNSEGALGLVVNRVIGTGPIGDMMTKLGIEGGDPTRDLDVHYGGPVELKFAFVLHSTDYVAEGGRRVDDKYTMTSRSSILIDIAKGKGPRKSLFALGYAGWGPGQLEAEMKRKDWFVIPADDALVFGGDSAGKWERAIANRGFDL